METPEPDLNSMLCTMRQAASQIVVTSLMLVFKDWTPLVTLIFATDGDDEFGDEEHGEESAKEDDPIVEVEPAETLKDWGHT